MSSPREFKQGLAAISRLWKEEKFDRALAKIESMLKSWPGNPHLHVLRASVLQLQEEPKFDLEEAKHAIQRAAEYEEDSPVAKIELGQFLDNVEDDPSAALAAYAKGVASARVLLLDGLIGQAKAYLQLGKKREAFGCLVEVCQLAQPGWNLSQLSSDDAGPKAKPANSHSLILDGPYAKQIQELLGELTAEQPA